MKRAIFPGSFDPFTIGHYDIVMRGLTIFDEIVIAVGSNCCKQPLFSPEHRLHAIEKVFAHMPSVRVRLYDSLTIDLAKEENALFLLRGVRTAIDLEYERTIADANRTLGGIETVILIAQPHLAHVSSTLVRDLYSYGKDISSFLPPTC